MKKQLITLKYMSTYLRVLEPRTSYRVITVVLCLFAKFQLPGRHGLRLCLLSRTTSFSVAADAVFAIIMSASPSCFSCGLMVAKQWTKQT